MIEWRRTIREGIDQNYEVLNLGNVRNFMLQRPLRPFATKDGYSSIGIKMFNHGNKSFYAHRLVDLAFIDNPENELQINHLNGNKKYDFVDNLEWATAQENSLHSNAREIAQLDEEDEIVAIDESTRSAAQSVNSAATTISAYIKNGRTLHGFKWQYSI